MKKIWVHNGQFHLDELMAICLYEEFVTSDVSIIRQDMPPEKFDVAIDVGGIHNPKAWSFDHHQDRTLPSACLLIADFIVPPHLMDHISPMLTSISDCDTGRGTISAASLNNAIRNFNSLKGGFDKALMCTREILQAHLASAKKAIKDVERWNALERISGKIALQRDQEVILDWKRLAQSDCVYFLVCPNGRGQGFHLITRDVNVVSIPSDSRQIFHHNASFMATYRSEYAAIEHGMELVRKTKSLALGALCGATSI